MAGKRKGRHPDKALSAVAVRNAGPGRHADGGGLYLSVNDAGGKSWILRTMVRGKRRDIGLGSASLVGLADARERAREMRRVAREGGDPLQVMREARRVVPTFEEAARKVHAEHIAGWKNAKHAAQWIRTLETYVFPTLGSRRVDGIDTPDIRAVLSPIWLEKAETARRVRQRISSVLDWSITEGFRTGENPVRSVTKGLPRQRDQVEHHEALPYDDVPGFVAHLRDGDEPASGTLAFEFLLLTVVRTTELRLALWPEIDEAAATWTIPGDRMKAGKEHVVPLVPRALEILQEMRRRHSGKGEFIFESRPGRPFSNGVFLATMRRLEVAATPHGFRSSFRDWAGERTTFPREIAEKALAHAVGSKTEAAYQRGQLLAKRRKLMEAWARFIEPGESKVVQLRAETA